MRRRAVLRAGLAGLAGVGLLGTASGDRSGPATGYAPLGRVGVAGAADCRISADGETAFLAVGDGFVAVSIATMTPVAAVRSIAADREGGPLVGVADIGVDGDRLLVPGPAHRRPDRVAGFALFDVGDPASPEQVAFFETGFPIHNAALADGRAYLTAGTGLVIVDVTDDAPAVVGGWAPTEVDPRWNAVPPALRVLHDVRVRGDLAVLSLWDAGTWLVDVSDAEDVTVVGRAGGRAADELAAVEDGAVRREAVEPPGNHHSAALSADGSIMAIGAEAFDSRTGDETGGPGGLDLYDVTDPMTPIHLSTIDPPAAADATHGGTWTTAHDFAFAGDRLLSAWYQGGVKVHDVVDPAAPVELAWWRRPAEAAFWTARPAAGDAFVASSTTLPGGDLFPGLYRFPNRTGEQVDPPSLTDPARSTPTASPSPTPTRTPGQPGFGPAAAIGGVAALAAWRRWRDRG